MARSCWLPGPARRSFRSIFPGANGFCVSGPDLEGAVRLLRKPVELEDGTARAKGVELLERDKDRAILAVTVTEGS